MPGKLRIIGGEFRSRLIEAPEGDKTRPTPDRLREALFNVLQQRIEGSVFVDAHAGSGAIGIEALSRGAERVIFFERNKAALKVINSNVRALKLQGRAKVIHGAAVTYLAEHPADIIFLDPPYVQVGEYEACLRVAPKSALVIAQHASREALEETYGAFHRTRTLRQGDNSLSFYAAIASEPQVPIAPADAVAEEPGDPDGETE